MNWSICRNLFKNVGLLISFSTVFVTVSLHAEIYIRVNQVGYQTQDIKSAMAFGSESLPETFSVVEQGSGKAVYQGKPASIAGKWGQFTNHAELDFSSVKSPGCYVLQMGDAKSQPFSIAANTFGELPDELLEFMRQQRCGYNPFLDVVCHRMDGRTAFGPMTNGTYMDAHGGWHDAGDLLKYLLTSGNATAQMLLAYKLNPHCSQDHFNALGQPGTNGIPDVLDEAHWGLEWMLRLHPAPDQLYHQVADDRDHTGFRLPHEEIADYGWGKGSYRVVYYADGKPQGLKQYKSESTGIANLAGRYAAAMALAYQIWKDDAQQKEFAERCLKAGIEVYQLGRAKEGVQQGNSYSAPYRYAETTWADDMEWGAAELFRATGKKYYLNDAKRYATMIQSESWMGQEQTGHYQYYPFMNVGHFALYDSVDKKFKKVLAGYYRDGIERCMGMGQRSPYRIGVPFIWCSNNLTTALATQILMYERMTGDLRYHRFMLAQRDWLLGRNPWGISMFTGIPEKGVYPHDVHLQTTKLTGRSVRGGLVDGPVYNRIFKSLKGVYINEPDPFAPFQDELAVYHDSIHDYSTNEPTMDGTASAVLLWAICAAQN
ncbi:glycoside hydrolase family 9 protein [Pedosphaera parvula]|uniref:Glycoside hydrolase family 9 n=1 Tax=Pedosphaera parvula (strain Ellin514) TaxID=320771 RepID=B9XKJ7_PEDPL|nr:glycoside hydrolase family 9 protein [Pedosphaera parvula]EEF59667.1 glycoside hydrolase family 9 [Pedosphaera parvula Ellin514]